MTKNKILDSDFFFTLSDDDYLVEDALLTMAKEISRVSKIWYCFNCISKSHESFDNMDFKYYQEKSYMEFIEDYHGDKHFVFKLKAFKKLRFPAKHFKNGFEHVLYYQIPSKIQIIPRVVKVIEYQENGLSMSNLYDDIDKFSSFLKEFRAAPTTWVYYKYSYIYLRGNLKDILRNPVDIKNKIKKWLKFNQ